MDQLINAFGLDLKLIVVQIINFGILLVALTYFLYQPVLKLLREREERIAQGITDAEAAAAALASADTEKRAVLKAAHQAAAEVANRAQAAATKQSETIIPKANEQATQLLAEAEKVATEQAAAHKRASEAEMAAVAVLAAEQVLRERATK